MQQSTPTKQSVSTGLPSMKQKWYERKGILVAWLIIFWPIGLLGLWKRNSTSTVKKLIVSAIVCGFFGLIICAGIMADREIHVKLSKAETLWSNGKHIESVALYNDLLNTYSSLEDKPNYSTILVRVIETELEQNNIIFARKLMERALRKNVPLSFQSDKASQLYLLVQTEANSKSTNEVKSNSTKVKDVEKQGIGKSISDMEDAIPGFNRNIIMGNVLADGTQLYNASIDIGYSIIDVVFYGPKENISQINVKCVSPIKSESLAMHTIALSKIIFISSGLQSTGNQSKDLTPIMKWFVNCGTNYSKGVFGNILVKYDPSKKNAETVSMDITITKNE